MRWNLVGAGGRGTCLWRKVCEDEARDTLAEGTLGPVARKCDVVRGGGRTKLPSLSFCVMMTSIRSSYTCTRISVGTSSMARRFCHDAMGGDEEVDGGMIDGPGWAGPSVSSRDVMALVFCCSTE